MAMALACVTVAALAATWPARLGGAVSYVSTHGTSMEPAFHQGDLAAVRASSTYRVGDVVAYRSRLLDTVVLHRIVAVDHGHFSFKGDNNSWQDADRPVAADLIGRLWLHIPRGGLLLAWLHTPALWAAGITLALGIAAPSQARRQRKRPSMPISSSISASAYWAVRTVAIGLVACAVAFAALGGVALAHPTTTTGEAKLPYTERGAFTYSAAVAPGAVYDDGRVDTGEPIYLRLAKSVDIHFAYGFVADGAAIDGTLALRAEVSDGSGWRRTIELQSPTPFRGAQAEGSTTLELGTFEALVAEVRAATGAGTSTYDVDILADVTVSGTLHGRSFTATFEPKLPLHLDALRLAPDGPAEKSASRFATSTTGAVKIRTSSADRLEVAGRGITTETARRVAGIGMVISTITAAMLIVAMRRRRPTPAARIRMQYRRLIVGVDAAEVGSHLVVFDVGSIADLARLAEQHASLMLHQHVDGRDTYLFQVGRTVYRHRPRPKAR
jgi:signal peptidase I